ncbi:MAG: toxin-antitoxin system TumE family protein [Halobacteriota archaeon]
MPATVAYRDEGEKQDGSRYEMLAWEVPVSEDFPRGLKYSFQYMDADGETLLRYDNSPYHLDVGRHHRHPPEGDVTKLVFTGLSDLIADFHNEVNEIYAQRTD